jgi:hypothetical protein
MPSCVLGVTLRCSSVCCDSRMSMSFWSSATAYASVLRLAGGQEDEAAAVSTPSREGHTGSPKRDTRVVNLIDNQNLLAEHAGRASSAERAEVEPLGADDLGADLLSRCRRQRLVKRQADGLCWIRMRVRQNVRSLTRVLGTSDERRRTDRDV